ncbi:GGDEF-domain containing protein, partial [Micromonospora humida]
MRLPPGMVAVAVLSGLLAVAATALLADSARRRGGPHRQAHLLFAVAAAIALTTLAAGTVAVLGAADHGAHPRGQGMGWASLIAVGTALSGLGYCAG